MYTQEEYLYGWLFYLMGVAVLMACTWWLTWKWRSALVRQLFCSSVLVLLIVPWYTSAELDFLAPAWIIAGFEGVFEGNGAFWRAGAPLLSCLALSSFAVALWHLGRRYWSK